MILTKKDNPKERRDKVIVFMLLVIAIILIAIIALILIRNNRTLEYFVYPLP
jgi:nitrate reductase NapE component